jgi:hypothetical protein
MPALRTAAAADVSPAEKTARRRAGLRKNSLAISIMILIEYGLGSAVSIYATVPRSDQGKGVATALGRALSNSPVILAVHAAFGLLFIIAGITVLVRAIRARFVPTIVTSAVGLLALLGAGSAGASFVNNGTNGASMTMAVLTGVALLCYLVNLFVPLPARSE